jgi:hypothetical protein
VERLARAPPWGWAARAPESKLRRALTSADRPRARAPRGLQQVGQGLAPGGVPLFLTDGFQEYPTALLTQGGRWGPPPRRQAPGPAPQPRGMPRPGLREAQGVQTLRRQRWVDGPHRGMFGTLEAVEQGGAAGGWKLNTACVERLTLAIRQHGAVGGRRGTPLGKGEAG